jgi:hypothetical protein
VPVTAKGEVINAAAAANRGYDGLHGWMQKAEATWEANKSSDNFALTELLDYFGQLSAQFPLAPLRVAYAASGTNPAACILRDGESVIEHKLYWCPVSSELEAGYLCAILNSEAARKRVETYQYRGQWGARDFDKVIFNLPIPHLDPKNETHVALASASFEAEKIAAAIELPEGIKFQRARGLVRNALAEVGIAKRIDELVAHLLDG